MGLKILSFFVMTCCGISSIWAGVVRDSHEPVDALIIGGGVGGGTAAVYLARAGFHPVVVEKACPAGAIAQSEAVENWPGEVKIRGSELMEKIHHQALENGAQWIDGEVVSADFSQKPFSIQIRYIEGNLTKTKTMRANTCFIATGSSPNKLAIPGENAYWGRGVSSCAVCDGSLYRDKKVGVVGGGDSAVLEALYLSHIAKDVTLFIRGEKFRALDIKKKEALLSMKNVHVFYRTALKEIRGDKEGMTSVIVQKEGALQEVELDGLFLAIGSHPNVDLVKGQVELDRDGYISVKNHQQTSIKGLYAIGDVAHSLKQAVLAAGDGAKAAMAAIDDELSLLAVSTQAKVMTDETASRDWQVIEISSTEQFEKELNNRDVPLVVDFYATWCPPCKRVAPRIESAAETLGGRVKFLKVNVELNSELARRFNIRAMPTVIYFDKEGVVLDRKVGEDQITELLAQISIDSRPVTR